MNDRAPLEGRQAEVFEVIRRAIRTRGRPVGLEEIAADGQLHDRSAAHKYVRALEEKGYLRQLAGHRGVELAEGSGLLLPLPGITAAGSPVANLTPDHGFFNFNEAFGGTDNFMLQVRGTSMIDEHIDDGDYVILRPAVDAEDGEKVVCEVGEDRGLTLKKLRKMRGGIYLYSANKAANIPPIRLDGSPDHRIVGVLVGVVRKER